MVSFKSLGTVSYSHSIATMLVSLTVVTQYTNVTDRQTDRHIQPDRHCTKAQSALMHSTVRQ